MNVINYHLTVLRSSKYKDKEGRCLLFVLNNPDHSPTLQRKQRLTNNNYTSTSNFSATSGGPSALLGNTPLPEGVPHPVEDKSTRDEPILWRLRTTISVVKVRTIICFQHVQLNFEAASSQTRRRGAAVKLQTVLSPLFPHARIWLY